MYERSEYLRNCLGFGDRLVPNINPKQIKNFPITIFKFLYSLGIQLFQPI